MLSPYDGSIMHTQNRVHFCARCARKRNAARRAENAAHYLHREAGAGSACADAPRAAAFGTAYGMLWPPLRRGGSAVAVGVAPLLGKILLSFENLGGSHHLLPADRVSLPRRSHACLRCHGHSPCERHMEPHWHERCQPLMVRTFEALCADGVSINVLPRTCRARCHRSFLTVGCIRRSLPSLLRWQRAYAATTSAALGQEVHHGTTSEPGRVTAAAFERV
jgi:hypothetical protein